MDSRFGIVLVFCSELCLSDVKGGRVKKIRKKLRALLLKLLAVYS